MRLYSTTPMNIPEKQAIKIRATWKKISRMGMPLFVLAFGTLLLLWMCICFVGFLHLHGTQRLLHESFVIESTLPCMAILSYILPVAYYWMLKQWIRRIEPSEV